MLEPRPSSAGPSMIHDLEPCRPPRDSAMLSCPG
jgi:hypothetical protein